jgi:hypothetical protein
MIFGKYTDVWRERGCSEHSLCKYSSLFYVPYKLGFAAQASALNSGYAAYNGGLQVAKIMD